MIRLPGRKYNAPFVLLGLILMVTGVLLVRSHAATPTASSEAEVGTIGANASPINDTTASGGQAVRFGAPACTNANKPANIIWCSGFESDDFSDWAQNQSCPSGATIVTSPVKSGRYAVKFTVGDNDTQANCPDVPSENPRAQLVGPLGDDALFPPTAPDNDDTYIGLSVFIPNGFPSTPSWFVINEQFGYPYGGSPTNEIDINGRTFGINNHQIDSNGKDTWSRVWDAPNTIHYGQWENFVEHIKWSTDPSVGYIEVWYNGVMQTLTNGTTRYYEKTIDPTINGGWNTVIINQYRPVEYPMGTLTLYQDDIRVGTTYDSVASGR